MIFFIWKVLMNRLARNLSIETKCVVLEVQEVQNYWRDMPIVY